MLTKLTIYTSALAIGCLFLLRSHAPPVKYVSDLIDSSIPADALPFLPFPASLAGVFVMGILVGIVANAIKLHDRISDLFRIRNEFDLKFVLAPLAIASGASLDPVKYGRFKEQRRRLMGETFYAYVSSTTPQIDRHTITLALTNWSWFWVCLEAIALLFTTGIVVTFYGAWQLAVILFLGCLVLLIPMRFCRLQSADYADQQIEQILGDPARRATIAAKFNAL